MGLLVTTTWNSRWSRWVFQCVAWPARGCGGDVGVCGLVGVVVGSISTHDTQDRIGFCCFVGCDCLGVWRGVVV